VNALFRVDGGTREGMGHLVRSRALAQKLKERGVETSFLTASSDGARWLAGLGETVLPIEAPPGTPEDARQVCEAFHQGGSKWILTDGYVFREDYLRILAASNPFLAVVDDSAGWFLPASVVVSGGLGAKSLKYAVPPGTRLLQGPEYLLLRPEFRGAKSAREKVGRVLVCFGGSDPQDYTRLVLEACHHLEKRTRLELVVGPAYAHRAGLLAAASPRGVPVHQDLDGPSLAALMRTSDLAIASAGMVCCELAALGVPVVLTVASEDQRSNAVALAASGGALLVDPFSPERLVEAAQELLRDHTRRSLMGEAASRLVDGLGADRVAEVLAPRGE